MLRWLLFTALVMSTGFCLVGLVVDLSYHLRYQPELEQLHADQKEQIIRYQQEKLHYQNHPVFAPSSSPSKDWAPYFRELTENGVEDIITLDSKKLLMGYAEDWLDKRNLPPLQPKADKLFATLHHFDHWQLDEELIDKLELKASDLVALTQLYLVNSVVHTPEAINTSLTQSRHLAKLLLSTEWMNFKRAGLSLLEKENQVIEYLQARRHLSSTQWTLVPKKEIKDFRIFLEKTSNFMSFLTDKDVLRMAYLEAPTPLGLCAAFNDRLRFLRWSQQFFENQFIFEPNYQPHLANLQEVESNLRNNCKTLASEPEVPRYLAQQIPYYRRLYGLRMMFSQVKDL